jgi:hypothetical protein
VYALFAVAGSEVQKCLFFELGRFVGSATRGCCRCSLEGAVQLLEESLALTAAWKLVVYMCLQSIMLMMYVLSILYPSCVGLMRAYG